MRRLGIYRRWWPEAKLLAKNDAPSEEGRQRWHDIRAELESYAAGNNPFVHRIAALGLSPEGYKLGSFAAQALSAAKLDLFKATHEIFSHQPDSVWQPLLARFWGYDYWRTRIEHYRQISGTSGMRADFTSAMASLANCLCAGWMTEATLLTEEILILYENKRFYDVGGMFGQPLYHWLMRICFDHWGWEFINWGDKEDAGRPVALSEPVLNELVAHWRDVDLAPMREHILWLCDYYTYRTKPADGYEFNNDLLLVRFPAVILAWQRLRQGRGLDNPPIDHPLMRPDYARLREPVPMYSDPLLDAVIARLRREEMPDLGAVRRPSVTPSDKKPSLLARLLGRTSPLK